MRFTCGQSAPSPPPDPCASTLSLSASDTLSMGPYDNSLDCSWLLVCQGRFAPRLTFASFATESGFDFVRVFDGETTEDTTLGRFHGDSLPDPVQGSAPHMLVQFTTDGSVTRSGFEASYECVPSSSAGGAEPPPPPECDPVFLGSDIGWQNVMTYHDEDGSCTISMAELASICTGNLLQACLDFLDSSSEPGSGGMTSGCSVEVLNTALAAGGYTTIQLKCELPANAANVYAMAGTPDSPMTFPAAFQVPAPFGSDIGAPNPAFIAFNADVAFDSYLTVGQEQADLSVSPGEQGADAIAAWGVSETVALETSNGAIFYMAPGDGPASDGAMIFAQLTLSNGAYAAGGSAGADLQGRSAGGADDWEGYAVAWQW